MRTLLMKKLFSKLIFVICIIYLCWNHALTLNAEEFNNSGNAAVFPATIQQNSNSAKSSSKSNNSYWTKSKNAANNLANKIQNSYNNTTSGIKTKLSGSKKTVNNADNSETVHNIIPDMKKNKVSAKKVSKPKILNKTNDIDNTDNIENIIPKEDKKKTPQKAAEKSQKQSLKSFFAKKQKNEKNGKLHFEKNSLMQIKESRNIKNIKEHINNEEYFQHNVKNKIYLDRFKTFGAEDEKATFYKKKNIFEDENGDIQIKLNHGKTVDQLMDEIEQSNPDEPDSKPVELSLRDSIAIAIAKHPDILSAKLGTEIYKDRILQEWSAYFPTFSAGFDWEYNYTKYHGYHVGDGYNSVYLPQASAGMLLYDFGKTKASVDIAKTDYDASRYNLQDSISTIIYNIKSAYYNVLFAEQQVEVYNKTIEDFDLQLASAQKYFSIGKKPQIDVLTAEYNAGNAKLNLVKANNTLENAKVQFANTLGLPEFANFGLTDGLPYVEYEIDLEELLKNAFNIRPDLLQYEKSVESNYLAVRRARRYFTPSLTANGGLAYRDIADSNTSNYRVGVDLSYNNFNLMQLKKEYDIAVKIYKKSLVDYDAKRQDVYLEVKQAFIDYNNAKQSVKQADLNVQQAKAQHYHATGRYKAGFGDAIEIKDAENTYLNAQLAYFQSLLDYNLALAELERVVGCPVENLENDETVESNSPAADEKEPTAEL